MRKLKSIIICWSFFYLFPHFHPFLLFTKTLKYNLLVCFLDLFKNPFFYIFTFFRFYKIMICLSVSSFKKNPFPDTDPDSWSWFQFPLFTKYTQTMVFFFLSIYVFKYSECYYFEENTKNIRINSKCIKITN